ncbi:MAG TPA: hypothetical protein VGE47_00010 [Burkholderiaceae bacterium]
MDKARDLVGYGSSLIGFGSEGFQFFSGFSVSFCSHFTLVESGSTVGPHLHDLQRFSADGDAEIELKSIAGSAWI